MAVQDGTKNDLHCEGCGYCLRGLPGDPIRCPECGHENDPAALRAFLAADSSVDMKAWSVALAGGVALVVGGYLAILAHRLPLFSLFWCVAALVTWCVLLVVHARLPAGAPGRWHRFLIAQSTMILVFAILGAGCGGAVYLCILLARRFHILGLLLGISLGVIMWVALLVGVALLCIMAVKYMETTYGTEAAVPNETPGASPLPDEFDNGNTTTEDGP
ncbi:MAG: hypothetical protein PVJ57_10410 [Phycisphaerae bacterium]|jgi:hypothetical protein